MQQTEFIISAPEGFAPVIEMVLRQAQKFTDKATLISLMGDLGVGKTTFTQQLAQYLGVVEPVTSPTFGLINSYELPTNEDFDQLVHIDAYRIEDISETGPLRLEELFATPRTLICLEWPEQIAGILPAQKIAMTIEITADEKRRVTLKVD